MTEILKIGVPTLVFQLLTSLSIALINRASSIMAIRSLQAWGRLRELLLWELLLFLDF